jgi:hypothetical protein
MEKKQKLWLGGMVVFLVILAGAVLTGYWWSNKDEINLSWLPIKKGEVVFENHDPAVNIQFNGDDPVFKSFIEKSGIFGENGLKLIDDNTGQVTYVTPSKIIISFEDQDQVRSRAQDENTPKYVSWEPEFADGILKIKYRLNYMLLPEEYRWIQVRNDFQSGVAFRLTQLSSKHHVTGTGSNPAQAQQEVMKDIINLDQANFIASFNSL